MDFSWIVAAVHLVVCPFTRRDEHFNMQAMHDVLYHGSNLTQFDHIEFSGALVPQTFIGAIFISVLASPLNYIIENCGLLGITKYSAQLIVRASLGACVISCLKLFQNAVKDRFGKQVADWFMFMSCSQFHFMFYSTRAIPNIMVMPLVLLSFRYWLLGRYDSFMWIATSCVIIFKFELIILFGLIVMHEVFNHHISLKRLFYNIAPATVVFLSITIVIDSCMWQRLTWPEGERVVWGTAEEKHSNVGTSPFLWYWYSVLPRALGLSVFFVPFGVYLERRMIPLFAICTAFILTCSLHRHKELRYIIYIFPLMNVIASCGCNILWNGRQKSVARWALSIFAATHMIGNVIMSITLLSIAHKTYPGGSAIQNFHNAILPEESVHIYIGELAAQTGVTRFTQINDQWRYNTTAITNLETADVSDFTHLMIEARSKYSKNLKPFFKSHDVIETVESFSHIHVNYQTFPPLRIKTKPIISILQKKMPYKDSRKRFDDASVINFYTADKMEEDGPWLNEPLEAVSEMIHLKNNMRFSNLGEPDVQNSNENVIDLIGNNENMDAPLFEPSLEDSDLGNLDVYENIEEPETKKSTRALVDSLIRAKRLKTSLMISPELRDSKIDTEDVSILLNNTENIELLPDEESKNKSDGLVSHQKSSYDGYVRTPDSKTSRHKIKSRRTKISSLAFDALQEVPSDHGGRLSDAISDSSYIVLPNNYRRKIPYTNAENYPVSNSDVESKAGEIYYGNNNALGKFEQKLISVTPETDISSEGIIMSMPSNSEASTENRNYNQDQAHDKSMDRSKSVHKNYVAVDSQVDKNIEQRDLKFLVQTKRKTIYPQQKMTSESFHIAHSKSLGTNTHEINRGSYKEDTEFSEVPRMKSKMSFEEIEVKRRDQSPTASQSSNVVRPRIPEGRDTAVQVFEIIPDAVESDSQYNQTDSLRRPKIGNVPLIPQDAMSQSQLVNTDIEAVQELTTIDSDAAVSGSSELYNLKASRTRDRNIMIWWNMVDTLRDKDKKTIETNIDVNNEPKRVIDENGGIGSIQGNTHLPQPSEMILIEQESQPTTRRTRHPNG